MKRKRFFMAISVFLSLLIFLSVIITPAPTVNAESSQQAAINKFITNWYKVALGRKPTKSELSIWSNELTTGVTCGARAAYGFLFSPEYQNKKKSNEAFVTDCYKLLLGRNPDASGKSHWISQLQSGKSRAQVFAGFVNSTEYYQICAKLEITAGYWEAGINADQLNNVNMFVARLYKVCLGRLGDKNGQADWVKKLIKGQISGSKCAHDFIFSAEYTNKKLSNGEFVKNLYTAIMGRSYDKAGYTDWVNKLKDGMSRDQVFEGFANSSEFDKLCKQYGISRGTYKATNIGNYKPFVAEYFRLDQLKSQSDKISLASNSKLKDQYGNTFSYAITNYYSPSEYEYLNNGKYNKLKGTLYVADGYTNNYMGCLKVYGGDNNGNKFLLYQSKVLDRNSKPVSFDINVNGVERVYIKVDKGEYGNNYYLGDCYFYTTRTSENVELKKKPISLYNFKNIGDYVRWYESGYIDNYSNRYGSIMIHDNFYTKTPEYLLNKKYKKFTCTLCTPKGEGGGKIAIIADGKTIYTSPKLDKTSEPLKVSVDITGVNDFKLQITNNGDPWGVMVANPYLYLK